MLYRAGVSGSFGKHTFNFTETVYNISGGIPADINSRLHGWIVPKFQRRPMQGRIAFIAFRGKWIIMAWHFMLHKSCTKIYTRKRLNHL